MNNKIQNVKIVDTSNNKTNTTETFSLNTPKNVETFSVDDFFNNDTSTKSNYVTKEEANKMLQNKMNEVAKANLGSTIEVNPKGIETDRDGHHYLTFTLKDNKGNRKIYTYRVNSDNTVKNTVHYEEYANGTHTRWREGMSVDSNVSGFTSSDANAFKKSGNAITASQNSSSSNSKYVSKEKATNMLEDKMNELKSLNTNMTLIKSAKGVEQDSAGHYYMTFTLKDDKGNSKIYTYRVNGNNKIQNTVHYEEYANKTHTRWREGMNVDSTVKGFTKDNAKNFIKSGDNLPSQSASTNKPSKNANEDYVTETDANSRFNDLVEGMKANYTITDAGTTKKDRDEHYYRQFTAKDANGNNYLFNYRINANKEMKCIINNIDNADGTYSHNNTDTNTLETKTKEGNNYVIKRFNIKTGKETYKSTIYNKTNEPSTKEPIVKNSEVVNSTLQKAINNENKFMTEDDKEKIYNEISDYYGDFDDLENKLKGDLGLTNTNLTMDNMITYMYNIKCTDTNGKMNKILSETKDLISEDTDRAILYLTPTKKNGTITTTLRKNERDGEHVKYTGEYVEFYSPSGSLITAPLADFRSDSYGGNIYTEKIGNEDTYIKNVANYWFKCQKDMNKFTNKFKNTINKNLTNVCFVHSSTPNNIETLKDGIEATTLASSNGVQSQMLITVDNLEKTGIATKEMEDAFMHECGHIYDFASSPEFGSDITDSESWKNIFDDIDKDSDIYDEILKNNAFENEHELFGEATMLYFNEPESLKMIKLDLPTDKTGGVKYNNLYEYFDALYKD